MNKVELVRDRTQVRELIDALIGEADDVLGLPTSSAEEIAQFREAYLNWEDRSRTILQTSFKTSGLLSAGPYEDFSAAGMQLLDLKVTSTFLPPERVSEVRADLRERKRVLNSINSRIDLYEPLVQEPTANTGEAIFLVHGQNLERREIVRRFIEKICDRPVIVLEEQPNQGRDLLGKLMNHAVSAAYAVVLLTGDDEGRDLGGADWRPRARQNVMLELGLFLGLLGRSNVAALYEKGVEIPSDYSGVVWIEIAGESWQMQLAREMKTAGIDVSLDKAL